MGKTTIDDPIRLKTKHGEFNARYVAEPLKGREGVALYGDHAVADGPVLLRVQSSCLFSESFWASECDCARQLQESLRLISSRPGIVVYFYEEGRGHGLQLKINAIFVQQTTGYDTAKAFGCIGAEIDKRSNYVCLPDILNVVFGSCVPVIVLTNSPRKLELIREAGIEIIERQSLICGSENPFIRAYLAEKRKVLNHDIPEDMR